MFIINAYFSTGCLLLLHGCSHACVCLSSFFYSRSLVPIKINRFIGIACDARNNYEQLFPYSAQHIHTITSYSTLDQTVEAKCALHYCNTTKMKRTLSYHQQQHHFHDRKCNFKFSSKVLYPGIWRGYNNNYKLRNYN